jgi:hypothetical protein
MALGFSLLASGATLAADHGFYVGGGLGQSESGVRSGSFNFKDRDSGYKLIAGFRPLDLLAAEFNYVDLGKPSSGGAQAHSKAVDGFVLLFLPVPVIDVYGKAGYLSWQTDASTPDLSLSRNGRDFAWGAGVQLHWGSLAARLEYEALDARELARPTFLSLGLTFTFL